MVLFENIAVFTGNMQGVSIASVIGVNPDIDTLSTPEAVIAPGGVYTFLSAAASFEVVSDSTQDAVGGTGASAVRLDLLDANWGPVPVTVPLTGTTPSPVSGGPYIRGNDMRISGAVGSNETNVGNITLRVAGGGSTVSYMLAGKGRAQQAIYSVPANRMAFAGHTKVGIIRAKQSADAEVELQSRAFGGGWIVRNTIQVSATGNVSDISEPLFAPPFFEKSDVRFVVTAVSANDCAISAVMQFIVVEDVCRVPAPALLRELRIG